MPRFSAHSGIRFGLLLDLAAKYGQIRAAKGGLYN